MPTVFQSGNNELKSLLKNPSGDALRAYFDARLSEWNAPTKDMGVFTVGVFYDLSQSLTASSATCLLDAAAVWPLGNMTDTQVLRYVDLLAELARISSSTEMPPNLTRHWTTIEGRARRAGSGSMELESIREHFRVGG